MEKRVDKSIVRRYRIKDIHYHSLLIIFPYGGRYGKKAVITWVGDMGDAKKGHKFKNTVWECTSNGAMGSLVSALEGYTKCNKSSASFNIITFWTAEAPDDDANIDRRAICYMRDPDTGDVKFFSLPAPVDSMCEDTPEGERVTATALENIVAALSTATGKTFSPLYGVVKQRR